MTKTYLGHGHNKSISWHADMPFLVRPKVQKRPKVIDGIKYYLGLKGETYVAELFDKMFKPII